MKQVILLAMVGLAFLGGVATAGFLGYGPLAFISYHILMPTNVTVIPAYINLGNLTPGSSGTITAKAEVSIGMNGTYTVELIHEDELSHVFSVFNVTVTIGNETVTLNLDHDETHVYLIAGTYDVTITINYVVKQLPKPPYIVNNQPFLVIHPKDFHKHEGSNSQGFNEGNENESD